MFLKAIYIYVTQLIRSHASWFLKEESKVSQFSSVGEFPQMCRFVKIPQPTSCCQTGPI